MAQVKFINKYPHSGMPDSSNGLGTTPHDIDQKTSGHNWNKVFNRREPTDAEKFDQSIMQDEYYDLDNNHDQQ